MGKKTAATAAAGQKSEAEDAADEGNGSGGSDTRPARRGNSPCRSFLVGFFLGVSSILGAAIWAVTLGREQLVVFLTEINTIAADAGLAPKDTPLLPVVCLTTPVAAIAVADVGAPAAGDAGCAARIGDLRKNLEAKHAGELTDAGKVREQVETACQGRLAAIRKELEAEQGKQCSSPTPVAEEDKTDDAGDTGDHPSCSQQLTHAHQQWTELRSQLQDSERASCKGRLEEQLGQVQDGFESHISALTAQLESSKGAVAGCEGRVSELAALVEESGRAQAQRKPSEGSQQAWPECAERGVVFRGQGKFADFEDLTALFGDAASGCWNGRCQETDKFETPRIEDCAHACDVLAGCSFWTHGEQDGIAQCFLRSGDGGRELADGFVSGANGCTPPSSTVPPPQAALAVLESEKLRRCDSGEKGEGCADLHDAMRTWLYGIENLKLALEGAGEHQLGDHLEQIWADAVAFVNTEADAEGLESLYPIAVQNNRVVFEAVRGFLVGESEPINPLDASTPRPVRGLLCDGPNSCQV